LTGERALLTHNPMIKKLQQRTDIDTIGADYEVNDYLDKLNVENKRKKELKDNADIVKKLKKRCEAIQKRVEEIGDKIKNRPQALSVAIEDSLRSIRFNNIKKSPVQNPRNITMQREETISKDSDSDSS
jgi:hypothetical protein